METVTADFHAATGWSVLDVAWRGVRVGELIARAEPAPRARFVRFSEGEFYDTTLTLEDALLPDVLLAHLCGDAPIARDHGGPVPVSRAPEVRLEVGEVARGDRARRRRSPGLLGTPRPADLSRSVARQARALTDTLDWRDRSRGERERRRGIDADVRMLAVFALVLVVTVGIVVWRSLASAPATSPATREPGFGPEAGRGARRREAGARATRGETGAGAARRRARAGRGRARAAGRSTHGRRARRRRVHARRDLARGRAGGRAGRARDPRPQDDRHRRALAADPQQQAPLLPAEGAQPRPRRRRSALPLPRRAGEARSREALEAAEL